MPLGNAMDVVGLFFPMAISTMVIIERDADMA